jgi:hypothetical protein
MKNVFFLLVFLSSSLWAKEPALTIIYDEDQEYYHLSDLLNRKDMVNVTLENDPIYPGHDVTYRAIPLTSLLRHINVAESAIIEFTTEDGYNASVNSRKLLNSDKKLPVAYLAIENPKHKWPVLKKQKRSAGPLLLVWKNAHLGSIVSEKWPYWVNKLEVKGGLRELYPAIFPKSKKYEKGFQVYRQNCFACHTLNKQGAATLGPDLNYPHSPTEYFKAAYLRKLIREPSSLRHWPNSKMASFSKSILSDEELSALLEYLKHMSKHKAKMGNIDSK